MLALVLQHLSHAELIVLGVADLLPQRAAALAQPGVELVEARKPLLRRLDPDPPSADLHVLLHHPLVAAAASLIDPASLNLTQAA